MNTTKTIASWLRSLISRKTVKQEIDEELRFHIGQRTAENVAKGMSPGDAAREARKCFGNLQSVREECRERRGANFGETTLQDARFGARMLVKHPGFTATVVVMLALGIGGNTAIFSVIYGVLFRPLPYDQPGQLVRISENSDGGTVAPGVFLDWKESSTLFEGLSLVRGTQMNLTGEAEPERIKGWIVSANILHVLGVRPRLGRDFLPNEDQAGHDGKVALLADSFWKRRFGADTNIVGCIIRLDGEAFTVVGVLPPRALVWSDAEIIAPVLVQPEMRNQRGSQMFGVFGRLKSGVTVRQAEAELGAIKDRLQSQYPKWKADWRSVLIPFDVAVGGHMRPTLLMLFGGVVCVLLIACINVANLLLVRGSARQREMAIRAALGASRWRIVQQALTESVLLGLIGGGLGVLLAFWGVRLLPHLLSQFGDPLDYFNWAVRLDGTVLAFALLLSLAVGIFFGLVPALSASAPDLGHALKDGGRGSAGISRRRIRSGLVASEVALSLMLLVTMGLFLKSLVGLRRVPTGYQPTNAMAMDISLPRAKYSDDTLRARFYDRLFERLAAQSQIEAVASASTMPMNFSFTGQMFVEGRKDQPEEGYNFIPFDRVRGQFFQTMGIPILRGRDFTAQDYSKNGAPVCLLSDELSKKLFPGEDPLGQRIRLWGSVFEIIGITGNTRHDSLNLPKPEGRMYVSKVRGLDDYAESLIVRTRADPLALAETIRKAVLEVDPDQPIANIRTLERDISKSLVSTRLVLQLLSLFGGLAVLLAAIGLYGVMAYETLQRTNEFGVRMALGARPVDVLKLVLKKGMRLTLIGIVVGVAGMFAMTRVIGAQLYEVRATDPQTLAAVALGLSVVAFLACWVPAYRATKVNPMTALRHE